MRVPLRRPLALALIAALSLPAVAAPKAPSPEAAEVRGVLLSKDGTPAVGYQVGLKSKSGDLFMSAPTGADGTFSVEQLPPDYYRLVAMAPDGAELPILGREVNLKGGQIERVELRLGDKAQPAGTDGGGSPATETGAAGGSKMGKAWSWFKTHRAAQVVVAVVGAFAIYELVKSDDNNKNNNNPSPSAPR